MSDPISPDHYQGFSNGAEVIDITENLTSNGGQAVQYIARSTRLDGVAKGAPLEDLRKARWFIEREITRLEALVAIKPLPKEETFEFQMPKQRVVYTSGPLDFATVDLSGAEGTFVEDWEGRYVFYEAHAERDEGGMLTITVTDVPGTVRATYHSASATVRQHIADQTGQNFDKIQVRWE